MNTIDRRGFLAMTCLGAATQMVALNAEGMRAKKPNIVFILADDLGRHQVGCYGNPFYETPNIDALAAQGLRFTDAYAAAPVCSPTRASIMTGKYPARLHVTDYIPGNPFPHALLQTPGWVKELPEQETTIAEVLAKAGYVSGHFGKWHLSKDKEYQPGRPGEPDTQGFSDVLCREKPNAQEAAKAGADPDYDAHHAREITNRAITFIENNRSKPFFCYVAHSLVHRPEMEYAPRIIKYAQKPEAGNKMGNNPVLGAMVETLDAQVGRLLETLRQHHLEDNTVVVFFSDNGDFYGREGLKPFYGSKADLFEGGIRMPLIMRWPGVVKAGTTCEMPVCSIDFLPTFAELAGAPLNENEVDGISIVPVLEKRPAPARNALFWHYPHYHSLGIAPSGAIRAGQYKLIEWFEKNIDDPCAEGALALYDLAADPGERNNLTAMLPEKTKELYETLRRWRKEVHAQEMLKNPDYDPQRAREPQ